MSTKGNITREKILDSTLESVFQNGIEATSISDIINKTGISKGSLYFHFQDKQTLISEALCKYEKTFFNFIKASLQGNSPGEKIDNFLKSVKSMHKAKNYSGGCLFGNTALEMADKNEIFSEIVKNGFDRWILMLSEIITDAQENDEIRYDMDALILANIVITSVEGGIMLSRLGKNGKPLFQTILALKKMLCLKQKKQ